MRPLCAKLLVRFLGVNSNVTTLNTLKIVPPSLSILLQAMTRIGVAKRATAPSPKIKMPSMIKILKQSVDDAKSLLSAVSDASTRVNLSSYIVNGFCRKYAN